MAKQTKTVQQIQGIQNFDKNPFSSNNQTVIHQPEKFIIDFKGISTQSTPEGKPTLIINHRAILLEPYIAKGFLDALSGNIKKYEEKFGKIKIPDSIEKAKKEMDMQKPEETSTKSPSYMG